MKRIVFCCLLLVTSSLITAQTMLIIPNKPWDSIRYSSYTVDNNIHIRSDITDNLGQNTKFYYTQYDGWLNGTLNHFDNQTYESVIPVNPTLDIQCRYRTVVENDFFIIPDLPFDVPDSLILMMPGYTPDNSFPPPISQMAHVGSDPLGDIDSTLPQSLDLTGHYLLKSDSHLFSALTNATGSFPTGFLWGPFNIYATIIFNPDTLLRDEVLYAIIRSTVPVVLPAGLYRITDLDNLSPDSFHQIGNISQQIVGGTLIKACNFSDLINDPDFGDWPNDSNSLAFATMTLRITLSLDVTFADLGPAALFFFDLENQIIEPFDNILPVLSDHEIHQEGGETIVSITYFDENGNFPIISLFECASGAFYQFTTQESNFQQPVQFTAILPAGYVHGTAKFSDNGYQFTELAISNMVLDAPVVSAVISAGQIHISWEPVNFANSYLIFSSENPYANDWGAPVGIVEENWFSEETDSVGKFYRVIASP